MPASCNEGKDQHHQRDLHGETDKLAVSIILIGCIRLCLKGRKKRFDQADFELQSRCRVCPKLQTIYGFYVFRLPAQIDYQNLWKGQIFSHSSI